MGLQMNRNFYRDAVSTYLILHCTQKSLEGYQYRMLAANRIDGILSCSLRTIDGETCLYYDVTGRESLARRVSTAGITGTELKKFLYSMTAMLHSLSDYLLDEKHLLLDPDYIFYDFEKEAYCFTYYPEMQQENGMKAVFSFLSEYIDPEDAEGTAVIYHLCDLAESPGFVLREDLLDHEYERSGTKQDRELRREAEPGSDFQRETFDYYEEAGRKNPDRRIRKGTFSQEGNMSLLYEENDTDDEKKEEEKERAVDRKGKRKVEKAKSPGKILGLAVFFLIGAGVLEASRFIITLTVDQKTGVHLGMISCLGMALITALYGTVYMYRKNREDRKEEKDRAEERKKNAMEPSIEYDRLKTDVQRRDVVS